MSMNLRIAGAGGFGRAVGKPGKKNPNLRSMSTLRVNSHGTAQRGGSFAQAGEPESPFGCRAGREANSVVFDLQRNFASTPCEAHCEIVGPRVFRDVVQRLLHR